MLVLKISGHIENPINLRDESYNFSKDMGTGYDSENGVKK